MIPVVGIFRGLFLGSVLVWYSSSVWKTMDNYYNQEFKKYLQKEKQARRIPTENEVCSALPEAPCTATTNAAARDDAALDSAGGEGGGGRDGGAEALGANAAPEGGASSEGGGGGGGGCTVNRDVTHTGAWRRRAQEAATGDSEDDGGTCPALFGPPPV